MYISMLTHNNVHLYGRLIPRLYRENPRLLGVVCLDEESNDFPIGTAVVEVGNGSLILRHIYVLPHERRNGAGRLMMEGIRDMCNAGNITLIETWFWEETFPNEETEGLEYFLLENGFINVREHPIYSCQLSELRNSSYLAKAKPMKGMEMYECVPFDRITDSQERNVRNMIKKAGDPDYLPYCRRDMSILCFKGSKITGCILSSDDPDSRVLTIVMLRNYVRDHFCALKMLAALKNTIARKLPSDYMISFVWAGNDITGLMNKVLDGRDTDTLYGYTVHGICEL